MNNSLTVMGPEQLRALAHPLRLRILDVLRGGEELTNRELASRLDVDPGHLHFHVRLLHRSGLIELSNGRRGREKPYRVSRATLDLASELAGANGEAGGDAALLAALERARRRFSARGDFHAARMTVRVPRAELRALVRDLALRAAELDDAAAGHALVTVFAHPADGSAPTETSAGQ
jgi:DNA-binding transcriptional ArsR family regulator